MTTAYINFFRKMATSYHANEIGEGEDLLGTSVIAVSASSQASAVAPDGATVARVGVIGGNVVVEKAATVTATTGRVWPAGYVSFIQVLPGDKIAVIAAAE